MTIIDGKSVAEKTRDNIKREVSRLKNKGLHPGLAVIMVGDDPASRIYVENKKKACQNVLVHSEEYSLSKNTTQRSLIDLINVLNGKEDIHGILVQLPLPKHMDEKAIIDSINPKKDVDAFHVENVGKVMRGEYDFLPCTPAGIMALLKTYHIDIQGKNCVVVGRSNIVGKPMSMLLLQKDATVTICHSKTDDLKKVCRTADILVVAIGKPKFITKDMVKSGAVVIDVGINRDKENKLCGDVDFENVKRVAAYITPVPGGVGPMTIAMLLRNTVIAAKIQHNIK